MDDHKYVDFSFGIELTPKYYYKVSIFVMTLEKESRNFDHEEIFEGPDLIECRNNAIAYYYDQMRGIQKKGAFHNLLQVKSVARFLCNFEIILCF